MWKTITPAEMRRVEASVMAKTSITGEMLMTRAAAEVARAVARLTQGREGKVLCLCGMGNNGGDGLAAMRLLAAADESFTGECWLLEGELSADAKRELDKLLCAGFAERVKVCRLLGDIQPTWPSGVSCVMDALFGTGLSRPLTGMAQALCALANAAFEKGVPVVAVDSPSGLHGETGRVLGCAIHATETIVFHRPKLGLYLGQGPNYAGLVRVADLGLPTSLDDADGCLLMQREEVRFPRRERVSHKGNYGRVLLWVGHLGMAGAAAICATAALRTGAGLVTVACPADIVAVVQTLCPCATCLPLPVHAAGNEACDGAENGAGDGAEADVQHAAEGLWAVLRPALERCDALGVGCGLGQDAVTALVLDKLVQALAQKKKPAVLDADALNVLALGQNKPFKLPSAVLTPHPAEAARLLGCTVPQVLSAPLACAKELQDRFGAAVVLKGAVSVLLAENGRALNAFGTPAMAKGGSGDALTGVLCALLAGKAAGVYADQDALTLLQLGCALHGLAGEKAEERYGERGVLATDLCECLGTVG
ncbi:MAG: NAD(P)H-hydrate dehydratase [Clostridia bacterium]